MFLMLRVLRLSNFQANATQTGHRSFSSAPHGYWQHLQNQRRVLDEIGRQLNIQKFEDWYTVRNVGEVIRRCEGHNFINNIYGGSLRRALAANYPEHTWNFPARKTDKQRDRQAVREVANQRQLVEDIGKQLGIIRFEDWYNVSVAAFSRHGGENLHCDTNKGSLCRLLISVYPEHPWEEFKFNRHRKWEDTENVRRCVGNLEKELGIQKVDEWRDYLVSKVRTSALLSHSATYQSLAHQFGGLLGILLKAYPEHDWSDPSSSTAGPSPVKTQYYLFDMLKSVLPKDTDVHFNFVHPKLLYLGSKKPMELDIYVPSLSLAFEYQGIQHYDFNENFSFEKSQHQLRLKRDIEKRSACKNIGLELIEIPYWWDGSLASLLATIRKRNPHLLKHFTFGPNIPQEVIENGLAIPETKPACVK
eukprot:TRINITY_DN9358_c0_g1_i1.p1 TRINITY_DN9358_c0_g1~~TRINITY_DN9358_c0_g1_i1.p1  ORF type:complete len:418 (+),score=72.81 TRINITY_DN9358_c0_g1_i1:58-1311(+)